MTDAVVADTDAIQVFRAGGTGLISGRKAFQRPLGDAVKLLSTIQNVYADKTITVAGDAS